MSNNSNEQFPPSFPGDPRRGRPYAQKSHAFLVFGIAIFFAAAFYAALIVITQVDSVLFPGSNIQVNLPLNIPLPGVDQTGQSASPYSERLNILVMGLDRRPYEEDDTPVRADSIFIVSIDTVNHIASVLSFPRDLWLEIPDGRGGFFQERINAAFAYGATQRGDEGGAQLTRQTIEHNFGIKTDRYIIIEFEGFEELVDALGGIDIVVQDRLYYDDIWLPKRQQSYVLFEPGPLHMDGELALAYVRIRTDSDLKRIERQQQVLIAMAEKALGLGALTRVPELWSQYGNTIKTDIREVELPGLTLLAKDIPLSRTVTRSLGDAVHPMTTAEGAAVLVLDEEKAQPIINEIFYDPRVRQEQAVVELRDGVGNPTILQNVISYLTSRGVDEARLIAAPSTAPQPQTDTYIYDLRGKQHTARKLAEWLGVSEDHIRGRDPLLAETTGALVDIVVVLGDDLHLPPPGDQSSRSAGRSLP